MVKNIYSKEIMEHFRHPRNVGKMKNYDGLAKIGNPICGDILWLYMRVSKNKKGEEIIKDASFLTFGCAVAIANGSLITTMIKGKTLEETMKITEAQLFKRLKDVPKIKYHCSILAIDAISEAIYGYLSKNKKPIPKKLQKRHQRIEKEKKEIEKRYKKWLK